MSGISETLPLPDISDATSQGETSVHVDAPHESKVIRITIWTQLPDGLSSLLLNLMLRR